MNTYTFLKMKKTIICIAIGLLALASCQKQVKVTDPITIQSPTPTEQITKVSLTETEKGYMKAGNAMAFRFLDKMYEGTNLIVSPLSLQYALAMTANGASGETLQEIVDFLGYGEDGIEALNAYCKKLIEELPAVDLNVSLKLTDAILANDQFPLLPAFKQTVESNYYAAVESMPFTNPDYTAARINEWASRSTNGFIDKVLEPSELSPDAVAYIMKMGGLGLRSHVQRALGLGGGIHPFGRYKEEDGHASHRGVFQICSQGRIQACCHPLCQLQVLHVYPPSGRQ